MQARKITPLDIYNAVANPAVEKIAKAKDVPLLDLASIDNAEKIQEQIQKLRDQDFDYRVKTADGKVVLVKDLRGKEDFNAIHPYESEIQALRYLAGMLLIHQSAPAANLLPAIQTAFKKYQELKSSSSEPADKMTVWLVSEFTTILSTSSIGGKADEQLNMAKDLGILLETHPDVCTISNTNDNLTVELSSNVTISPKFYDEEMDISKKQEWFTSALKFAGLKTTPNWLEVFFKDRFDDLKEKGVTAPPSARWLPLPANNQNVSTYTAPKDKPTEGYTIEFTRFGTPSSYDVKNAKEQERLAEKQLDEVTKQRLRLGIARFHEGYEGLVNEDFLKKAEFQFNYLHLLSPIAITKHLPIKDNNAWFVASAKAALEKVAKKAKVDYPQVEFNHTNSAVNAWAGQSQEFKHDKLVREHKIKITYKLLDQILEKDGRGENVASGIKDENALKALIGKIDSGEYLKNANPAIRKEITMRLQAAFYLDRLLKGESPFKELSAYERNIMMVALEFHVMGSQACTIAGCKSARDRTAVFAAAARTMQENPEAMHDWKKLNTGIMRSLEQGHHFRSLIYHTAVVKLSDVHKNYANAFSKKAEIKKLAKFTKKIKHDPKKKVELPIIEPGVKHMPKAKSNPSVQEKITDYKRIRQTEEQRLQSLLIDVQQVNHDLMMARVICENILQNINPAKPAQRSTSKFLDHPPQVQGFDESILVPVPPPTNKP